MKRTSLWEICDNAPIVTKMIVRRWTRMFEDGMSAVFHSATRVKGRSVVSRRGSPWEM